MNRLCQQVGKRNSLSLQNMLWVLFAVFVLLQELLAENAILRWGEIGRLVRSVDEVIIVLLALPLIISWVVGKLSLTRLPIYLPVAGVVVIGGISSIYNRVPIPVWLVGMFLTVKGFLLLYIIANMYIDIEQIKKLTSIFAILGLIILSLGFIDLFFTSEFRGMLNMTGTEMIRARFPSVQSILMHPGVFGWFMAFMAAYAFAFFIVYQSPRSVTLACLFTIGAFLSMRRKPLIGLFVALLVGIIFVKISQKNKILAGLSLVIIGSMFLFFSGSHLQFLWEDAMDQYVHRTGYQGPRLTLYAKGFEIAKDYFPIGAGFGRFGSWISRLRYSPLYHEYGISDRYGLSEDAPWFLNDTYWPAIMGETGFIGTLFMVFALTGLLLICKRIHQNGETPFEKAFALGTFLALTEGIVESLSTSFFVRPPQVYFVLGAVGLVICMSSNNQNQNHLISRSLRP